MIGSIEEIADVFSIFHDGCITANRIVAGNLELEVEIEYLARRINQTYTKFLVSLLNSRDFSLGIKTDQTNVNVSDIHDPQLIFSGDVEILYSKMKGEFVEIDVIQHDNDSFYETGYITFKADSALVTDQGGKNYTIEELGQLCHDYWSEWAGRN